MARVRHVVGTPQGSGSKRFKRGGWQWPWRWQWRLPQWLFIACMAITLQQLLWSPWTWVVLNRLKDLALMVPAFAWGVIQEWPTLMWGGVGYGVPQGRAPNTAVFVVLSLSYMVHRAFLRWRVFDVPRFLLNLLHALFKLLGFSE